MGLHQDIKESVDGSAFVNLQAADGTGITQTGGSLDVNVTSPISSGTPDGTAFAAGVDNQQPIGGVFDDTPIADLATGTSGGLRATAKRGLHVNLRNAAGAAIGVAGAALVVDGSAVTQPVSDGGGSLTVDAVNLDIRDLSSATDSVSAVVTSSALPTGAATEASLAALLAMFKPASSTLSQVARSNVSQIALASNAARKGFIMVNDSGVKAWVAFAATATSSAYTYPVQANSIVEKDTSYTGVISVIWGTNGAGNLVVTELT